MAGFEIRREGHRYKVFVNEVGELLFTVDEGEPKYARSFKDGRLIFNGAQELFVNGQYSKVESFEIPTDEYERLSNIQMQILKDLEIKQSAERLRLADKSDILKYVDKWKYRIRSYRIEKKIKNPKIFYAIHHFKIGAQTYWFYERKIKSEVSPDGILINPTFKVSGDMDKSGAVPVQLGEIIFWRFYHDGDWETLRELTFNELICIEIIKTHGAVVSGKL